MLNINDIERLLESIGCTDKYEVQYAIQYTLPSVNQYIYINKEAGRNYSGLVVHPRYQAHREELLTIPGVQSQQKYNHKSSMRKFPKRQNNGKEKIPYGIPFGFDTETAFHEFIDKLISLPQAYISNELEDIEEAENQMSNIPATEREALVKSRLGQGRFRNRLIELWETCSVTSCSDISVLKASHIKPWRDSNNEERLDFYNGFLLTPNLDAAFDTGLISFENDGAIIISSFLTLDVQDVLGIHKKLKIAGIKQQNKAYLDYYHRKYIYQQ
jgi:putative restriction endonuclease